MTQAYAQLVDSVQLVRRSWQIRRALEGVVLLIAVGASVLLIAALLDRLFAFDTLGRSVLWAAFWIAAIAVLVRFIVLPMAARHTDDYFAALIEQRHPTLRNRLINALQLGREDSPRSPKLVDAIIADGAAATDDLDPSHAVASPAMKRYGIAAAVVAVLALAFIAWQGEAAGVSLKRIMLPWADIPPFTYTSLSVTPDGPRTLLEGSPLEITARAEGERIPGEASLHWKDAQGRARSLRMNGRDGVFAHAFPSLESSLEFYVSAGDARSRRVAIGVEPRPRIAEMAATYHYPAYTALESKPVESFDGHLHGLPQTKVSLALRTNKPLERLSLSVDGGEAIDLQGADDGTKWTTEITLTQPAVYYYRLRDRAGNEIEDATRYTIAIDPDAPPMVAFAKPGRDLQVQPDAEVEFAIVGQDDYGVGPVKLLGRVNPDRGGTVETVTLNEWPNGDAKPQRRVDLAVKKTVADLGLKAGDRLEYWASVIDLNDVAKDGPGKGESRRFNLIVLTPEQSQALLEKQLAEYAKVLTELIRLQRLNRNEAAGFQPPAGLIERQSVIRRGAQTLAETMQKNAFPGQSIIDELRRLAADQMAKVITSLESYRDAKDLDAGKRFASGTLPLQDEIIERLEEMLKRLNRDTAVRQQLKKIEQTDKVVHQEVQATLGKLAQDLDKFLAEQRELREQYEKMNKRDTGDEAKGLDDAALAEAQHRLDRWKQWAKDTVDGLTKLPEGFVKDSDLANTLPSIFEEIEKKKRGATQEIATPLEEGAKGAAAKALEDLEIWQMEAGDSARWVMEEPMEGKFQFQPTPLPEALQDLIGDLIEDMGEFDEGADDVTASWGGEVQAGWDIADGPISTFNAVGKTGNQLPNNSELTGRSGAGRRGKATGQMVGDTSTALEGRPTPARVTNERYEEGQPKADKQLDPRGATGGGKKTGGGARGLQGGNKPDFVRDMNRLAENQALLRERTQQIARQLENTGRPAQRVNRALELMKGSEQDLRDLRYDDAARKRKMAIDELRTERSQIDQAVNLSLQKAQDLPPEMRQEISAGAQQALPEGYEDLVGAYYKALSGAGSEEKP